MSNNNNSKRRGRSGKRESKALDTSEEAWAVPPRDISNVCYNQCARYENINTLSNAAVNAQNLVGTLNVMASSSTNVYTTFFAIKIKKIVLRSPANNSSVTSQMAFEWQSPSGSSVGNKPAHIAAGSVGSAYGGVMVIKPPKGTQWSNWITLTAPGGVTIWTWSLPAGSVIDIHYHAYIENRDSTIAYTVSGASGGSNYRMGLDSLPLASTNYTVVGYRQI